jgi:hypothetical protein
VKKELSSGMPLMYYRLMDESETANRSVLMFARGKKRQILLVESAEGNLE